MREKDSKKPAFLKGNVGQMKNSGSDSALNLEKHMKNLTQISQEMMDQCNINYSDKDDLIQAIMNNSPRRGIATDELLDMAVQLKGLPELLVMRDGEIYLLDFEGLSKYMRKVVKTIKGFRKIDKVTGAKFSV